MELNKAVCYVYPSTAGDDGGHNDAENEGNVNKNVSFLCVDANMIAIMIYQSR